MQPAPPRPPPRPPAPRTADPRGTSPRSAEAAQAGRRTRARRTLFALGAAAALLAAGLAAYLWTRPAPQEGPFVAVWMTDLPGGFDEVVLDILGVTVGGHALRMEQPEYAISRDRLDQGQGTRIASGHVPAGSDGSISVFLSGARGLREGAWVDIEVPNAAVTVEGVLRPDDHPSHAALFHLDLEGSLRIVDGQVAFYPLVQNVYYAGGPPEELDLPFEDLFKVLQRIEDAVAKLQKLEDLPAEVVRQLCDALGSSAGPCGGAGTPSGPPGCELLPAGCGGLPSGSPSCGPGLAPTCPGPSAGPDSPGTGNLAPDAPTLLGPSQNSRGHPLSVELRWQAADPDGDAVTYRVLLDGVEQPACAATAAACSIPALNRDTEYRWRVIVRDARDAETTGPEWRFRTNAPPNVPTGPVPATGGSASLAPELRWTAAVDPDPDQALDYRVETRRQGDTAWDARCDWGSATSCAVSGLSNAVDYEWRVLARDPHGETAVGSTWSFRTTNAAPVAASPATPAAGGTSPSTTTFTWNPGSDPDGGPEGLTYLLVYYLESQPGALVSPCEWSTGTSCTASGLVPGAKYWWYVRTTDGLDTVESASRLVNISGANP